MATKPAQRRGAPFSRYTGAWLRGGGARGAPAIRQRLGWRVSLCGWRRVARHTGINDPSVGGTSTTRHAFLCVPLSSAPFSLLCGKPNSFEVCADVNPAPAGSTFKLKTTCHGARRTFRCRLRVADLANSHVQTMQMQPKNSRSGWRRNCCTYNVNHVRKRKKVFNAVGFPRRARCSGQMTALWIGASNRASNPHHKIWN